MSEGSIIVVAGGGPAGVSASISLARSGARVLLVEQRDRLGGAIHRQPSQESPQVFRTARHAKAWLSLVRELTKWRPNITIATSTVFAGVDGAGFALLDNRRTGEMLAVRPLGMILALGATELVHPFPGWELPGVFSAGGVQVLLKETGHPLEGQTLIAGSGPLLLALGAQLSAAGRPPVAILERAPVLGRPAAALSMLRSLPQFAEGAGYSARLLRAGVPYNSSTQVASVAVLDGRLAVETVSGQARRTYQVDNLVIHDGIRPGHLSADVSSLRFPVVEAGDGREILGAHFATVDGRLAAARLLSLLGKAVVPAEADERALRSARRLQNSLSVLFKHQAPPIPPQTIICRCECQPASALPDGVSPREAKLVGRFGMGVCQGRFCAAATARALGDHAVASDFRQQVMRWPIRPVSAASLGRLRYISTNLEKIWNNDGTTA
jgi:hypothetical protein